VVTVTSTIPAAMDAFVDGLLARPGLEGVQIASGYLGADSDPKQSIQLTGASRAEQVWGMLGNRRRDEEYTLDGLIWIVVPGKNEPVIREARNRAFLLLAEIEDFLRVDPRIGQTTKVSQLSRYPFEQGANDIGRWCQIDFEIACEQDLRSS
jgi:hypothetical protein